MGKSKVKLSDSQYWIAINSKYARLFLLVLGTLEQLTFYQHRAINFQNNEQLQFGVFYVSGKKDVIFSPASTAFCFKRSIQIT